MRPHRRDRDHRARQCDQGRDLEPALEAVDERLGSTVSRGERRRRDVRDDRAGDAIPSEPPTWRMLFRTAEPTPAWSRGTELIAAAVVGVIVSAMPMPISTSPGRMSQ